ncbi:ribosomal protein L15 [Rhizodiscina lignyota]|uniref:Ribosomal protein L15 n=1 Tax=Rhizodiscina lignyota TaxID=1504668 RepID=A0A9P4IJ42_9PEZI|nr:ribosomal protein L15 [Rhizodiscina lignyota]
MPPRLQLARAAKSLTSPQFPVATFLVPFLHQQRHASILGSLSDAPGAYNKRIRRGRGPSSGKGKTSGRGHKGQKQHGKVPAGFNGGQTTDEVTHGPRGFKNIFAPEIAPVNLDRIQEWIDKGRLDASKPITLKELARSRCIHGVKDGVKLLAKNAGELRTPINIIVSRASATAVAAVEKRGGSVISRYYTAQSIRQILKGDSHPFASLEAIGGPLESIIPMSTPAPAADSGNTTPSSARIPALPKFRYRLPDPAGRTDIEYYRDPAHRGYLVHTVKEGEGPSLFFKPPKEGEKRIKRVAEAKKKAVEANKLW